MKGYLWREEKGKDSKRVSMERETGIMVKGYLWRGEGEGVEIVSIEMGEWNDGKGISMCMRKGEE